MKGDPKAIRKAIMTAKSIARLIDPHFGRVPLPELGDFGAEKPFHEHSPMVHASYGEPMPEHFAGGGDVHGQMNYNSETGSNYNLSTPVSDDASINMGASGYKKVIPDTFSVGGNFRLGDANIGAGHSFGRGTNYSVNAPLLGGNIGVNAGASHGFVPDSVYASYVRRFSSGGYADGGSPENPYAQPDEMGMYSHAANVASQLPQERGSPEQFAGMLQNQGVRPTELEHSGFDQAFADRPQVTREQVAQHFHENMPHIEEKVNKHGPSPQEQYELRQKHGKEITALQERMRSMPFEESKKHWKDQQYWHAAEKRELAGKYDRPHHDEQTIPGGTHYREILLKHGGENKFPGVKSHFGGEPNILASLLMKDRQDISGKKVAHIEELQSDWGQKGRTQGFAGPIDEDEFQRLNAMPDAVRTPEEDAMLNGMFKKLQGIAQAPYVTKTEDWLDLGLKRALLEAAHGGHDKLAWNPGDVLANRYDLSKHIGEIRHEKNDDGSYNLDVTNPKGDNVFYKEDIPAEDIPEHVGKDMAEKIFAGHGEEDEHPGYRDWRSLRGLDLKVGGEGMRKFYDELLPKRLLKLAKQHDPESTLSHTIIEHPIEHDDEDDPLPDSASTALHSIDITPRMRESILRHGFKAYAGGGGVEEHTGADLLGRDPALAESMPKWESNFASIPAQPFDEMSASEKRLLSAPQLSSGFSIAKVDPTKGTYEDPVNPHETYSGIFYKGKGSNAETGYAGGFRHIVPASKMFMDWHKRQPESVLIKKTGKMAPLTQTNRQHALLTQHLAQIANQEWLDTVMPEYEKGKKWGYKKGGTVKRALMIAKKSKK